MNPLHTPSQSSFIFQQRPSLMEINLFNRNNSSHIFDDEGDALKQILRASSDNYFKSSMSFDSPKYPYGNFVNIGNNFSNNNNNGNNNIEQKGVINERKNNNDIPYKPLTFICNKNNVNNINSNKTINNSTSIYGNSSMNIINCDNNQNESDNTKKK